VVHKSDVGDKSPFHSSTGGRGFEGNPLSKDEPEKRSPPLGRAFAWGATGFRYGCSLYRHLSPMRDSCPMAAASTTVRGSIPSIPIATDGTHKDSRAARLHRDTVRSYSLGRPQRSAAIGEKRITSLTSAWHRRVMADEVVAHAFSHGFHPQRVERLAAYRAEALGARPRIPGLTAFSLSR